MTTIRRRKKNDAELRRVAPLSQTAEYAIRAMAHLARVADSEPAVRARDLSRATLVPVHYLSKVMRRLVAAGLLVAQKGHGGGFSLARPAATIRFSDVLAAVDEAPNGDRCAFGWGSCDARTPCPLHPAWSRLNEALIGWAAETTLAHVSPPVRPVQLRRRT
jgi:Rrf2 family protein